MQSRALFAFAMSVLLLSRLAAGQELDVPQNLTLRDSTANVGNILKGPPMQGVRFLHNYGTNNTFLGINAGNFTMSGANNTGNGAGALFSNYFGTNNTASGVNALFSNTVGRDNTATGAEALFNNFNGVENTATGAQALHNNSSGSDNTATGFKALISNTSGGNNTGNGHWALRDNTTGYGNTANGAFALLANNADYNTATGFSALNLNTSGISNTATGNVALYGNMSGSNNTATGESALANNVDGSNNTASGLGALGANRTGDFNTATGLSALSRNTTGSHNTAIGDQADVSVGGLINATAIGAGAFVNASNKVRLGNDSVTVIEGLVGFSANSDRNRVENLQPVRGEEALTKIRRLSLTSWNFIGQDATQFRHYGPMAQDFFAAFGHDAIGTIGTETTITSTDVDGILMVAAQALERRTRELGEETAVLRSENAGLKARLEALERRINSHALTKAE